MQLTNEYCPLYSSLTRVRDYVAATLARDPTRLEGISHCSPSSYLTHPLPLLKRSFPFLCFRVIVTFRSSAEIVHRHMASYRPPSTLFYSIPLYSTSIRCKQTHFSLDRIYRIQLHYSMDNKVCAVHSAASPLPTLSFSSRLSCFVYSVRYPILSHHMV